MNGPARPRVMKGVYYHVGSFRGHTIERSERTHVDTGLMVATNKNIYFDGPKATFRIPYAKIVAFETFSNGLGLIRDSRSAKHEFLVTHDGWFTYNLLTNLARL